MALPTVDNQFYPTPEEVHNQILADLRFGYQEHGIIANVEPGSELYIRAEAFANRVSIAIANNKLSLADLSPLDASGAGLEELARVFGVEKRPPAKASGFLIVSGPGAAGAPPTTIPANYICTSPSGLEYQTLAAVTVDLSAGATAAIEVQSLVDGANTDVKPEVVMTWNSAAVAGLNQTAPVEDGGIDGGSDADTDEDLRQRLLDRLGFPGVGGNWSQVIQWAQDSSSSIDSAYVYPAVRGPSSYDVAVLKDKGDRSLSSIVVNAAANYIIGQMPGHADLNVTTGSLLAVDVIINMTLPLPQNAGGAGGGWRDGTPWPSTAETGVDTYARITAFNLANRTITVDSTTPDAPLAGQRFGIWNPNGGADSDGEMNEYTIQTVGGASGAYVITVTGDSSSLQFVAVGMFCSAGAQKLKTYGAEFLSSMQVLGPGQKTTNVDILHRARRRPSPDLSSPSDLTTILLSKLSNEHPEILNLTYAATVPNGGLPTAALTITTPTVPATTTLPPRVFTLGNLSFRRQV